MSTTEIEFMKLGIPLIPYIQDGKIYIEVVQGPHLRKIPPIELSLIQASVLAARIGQIAAKRIEGIQNA
jgi:hypothetical protein